MDFSFTDEQLAVAALAKQILGDGATHERLRTLERGGGVRFDADLWRRLAEAGLVGIAVPEADGGGGLGFVELMLVLEQVGRTTAPVPYLETAVSGALTVAEFGSAAQRAALLPGLVSGEIILTAAERVVLRDGVTCLTLEAVACEANLSKGGVLYHFATKEALIQAMLERLIQLSSARNAGGMAL